VENGGISVVSALRVLADQGVTRVFSEGGGTLAASMLQANVVDELAVFNAGLAIGAEGMPSIGAMGLSDLGDATRLRLAETRNIGADVLQIWRKG
jgi:diaminohydroxyphosphoribosylaminopyrimidine deaminase/5-amino-6-(5-phosphoribosylamino)uracil reductase